MSTDALDDALDEIVDQLPKKRFSGKKLVIALVAIVLLLGIGGAAAWFFFLREAPSDVPADMQINEDGTLGLPPGNFTTPGLFFEMPDILVNLNTESRRQQFLKLSVTLEVGSEEDLMAVETVLPRVQDAFQVYLRELRPEDLEGSAGLYRIKEELLRRVNQAARPTVVRDVLFREMLIQ